jgi:hypothetical protein
MQFCQVFPRPTSFPSFDIKCYNDVMAIKKFPTKGWLYVDESYKKVITHALTLPSLMKKIDKVDKKGVIAKTNKTANAYIG